jgi:hypothetical protein
MQGQRRCSYAGRRARANGLFQPDFLPSRKAALSMCRNLVNAANPLSKSR